MLFDEVTDTLKEFGYVLYDYFLLKSFFELWLKSLLGSIRTLKTSSHTFIEDDINKLGEDADLLL